MDHPPLALTLDQAADVLGVSKGTVRNLISRGELRIARIAPRSPRVPARELEKFVADRTTTTAQG